MSIKKSTLYFKVNKKNAISKNMLRYSFRRHPELKMAGNKKSLKKRLSSKKTTWK